MAQITEALIAEFESRLDSNLHINSTMGEERQLIEAWKAWNRRAEAQWQPIETAPKDKFVLLCGPSGYTTTPLVFTTGRMCSDYHVGRWIDHANDDLTDWGFEPTHWMPLPAAPEVK